MVALLALCGAVRAHPSCCGHGPEMTTGGDDEQTATHQDVFWKASLTGPTSTLGELCLLSYLL